MVKQDSVVEELSLNANYCDTADADKGGAYIPAYSLTNLRANLYNVARSDFDLAFYVNNVFDKGYALSSCISSRSLGFDSLVYGAPRLWGKEARYNLNIDR
ncbi:hypothetical protein GCM10027217_22180 [Pseudomaricurvus hydrocarbonicus]